MRKKGNFPRMGVGGCLAQNRDALASSAGGPTIASASLFCACSTRFGSRCGRSNH
jgi:hypothetical protein